MILLKTRIWKRILTDTYILDLMLLLLFYYQTCLMESLSVLSIKAKTLYYIYQDITLQRDIAMPRGVTSFKETEKLLHAETK